MAYIKLYLTLDQQLALIRSRGMVVGDDNKAKAYLGRVGYYRLSGYWYPYRIAVKQPDGTFTVRDQFKADTNFAEIVELYVFDKMLRLLGPKPNKIVAG